MPSPALGLQTRHFMRQAFFITLRYGFEAFLVVGIGVAYLRKTGQHTLVPAVRWGIAASVGSSAIAASLLSHAATQALWDGVLSLVAAALAGWLMVHVLHADKCTSLVRSGAGAVAAVFAFTMLMITRRGMDIALLFNVLWLQVRSVPILAGSVAGTVAAAFVAWMWARYGQRVHHSRFVHVTAVFLVVFVLQLVIYGFHDLTEANLAAGSQVWHDRTQPYGP